MTYTLYGVIEKANSNDNFEMIVSVEPNYSEMNEKIINQEISRYLKENKE